MSKRWWLWLGSIVLIVGALAYTVWVVSPWCGGADGESRSAGSIAAETDIVVEMTITSVEVDGHCEPFVTMSGAATGVVVPDNVTVPASLDVDFFTAGEADRSGLQTEAKVVVGFDGEIDDVAVTSVGIMVDDDHVVWIAPSPGWKELPPSLSNWLGLVASSDR
jgi:hypothetical protein